MGDGGQARLYELLRESREGHGLGAPEIAAIVESALREIGLLESAGALDAEGAARWREAFAAEAAVVRDGAGERSSTAGLHFGTARFGRS